MIIYKCVPFLVIILHFVHSEIDSCDATSYNDCNQSDEIVFGQKYKKYLLYDINSGEGFNLRRDVYMRVASLVHQVNQMNQNVTDTIWILVLPLWGPLYHWKSGDIEYQSSLPWSLFFDIPSLNEYVPVIEYGTFLKENEPEIDEVYYLQHYPDIWEDNQWRERYEVQDCIVQPNYHRFSDKLYGWTWGYNEIRVKNFYCLSIQGTSKTLVPLLKDSKYRTIMIDRAEVILHDYFGGYDYWMARKSMKFSEQLIKIADEFRKLYLNSSDTDDCKPGSCFGGPYLGAHLRRQDFIRARPKDVPSIICAANQIKKLLQDLKLTKVFIATDATKVEIAELKGYLPNIVMYKPEKEIKQEIKDGGIAIVEQWICAHARYFIGTYESTFSFRIQEEREILGFHPDSTFNRFCGDGKKTCKQPTRWTIVNS